MLNEVGYKHMSNCGDTPGDVDRLSGWWGDRSGYPAILSLYFGKFINKSLLNDILFENWDWDQFVFKVNQDFAMGF